MHDRPDRGEGRNFRDGKPGYKAGFKSGGKRFEGGDHRPGGPSKGFQQKRNHRQDKPTGPVTPAYQDNRSSQERLAAKKKEYRPRGPRPGGAPHGRGAYPGSPAPVSKVYGEPAWDGGNPQSRNPKFGGKPPQTEKGPERSGRFSKSGFNKDRDGRKHDDRNHHGRSGPHGSGFKKPFGSPQRATPQQFEQPKPAKPKVITNVPPILHAVVPPVLEPSVPPTPRRKGRGVKAQTPKSADGDSEGHIRLNKFLSIAGFCSRRKADQLIEEGRIKVNGQIVDSLGTKINPLTDRVFINEKQVVDIDPPVYIVLNKPKDCITTASDEKGRTTVMDYVQTRERVYPIGRLDRNTTGVLLLTNDGEFANKMMHPRLEVKKAYKVSLDKPLLPEDANRLRKGIRLYDGNTKPAEVHMLGNGKNHSEIGIVIHEGKNRQIHRMFESLDYVVEKLERVAYAEITTAGLPRGEWRYLSPQELRHLRTIAGIEEETFQEA